MKLRGRLWLPVLAALVLALVAAPAAALARDYSITAVDIDATVTEDGTLRVAETRTFDFDGAFNGVYWKIPTGRNSNNGRDVGLTVDAVGEGAASDLSSFALSETGAAHTYELAELDGYTRVKLYSPHEDEEARFTVVYELTGVATRWEDTAELYWKFVSDGWDVESQNVTCTLHLPVPAGDSVSAGDNVRAWGHGPLDADVAFNGDEVVYTVPGVGTEEFAEMRVVFPAAWVAGCEQTLGTRLDAILSEEQAWADEANARRERARMLRDAGTFGSIGLAAVTAIAVVAARLREMRSRRPEFQDTYFRDVPTRDHPAVLGVLYNGGDAEPKELTATLMRLTDNGVIKLEKASTTKKVRGVEKPVNDYLVTKLKDVPKAEDGAKRPIADSIDATACDMVFNKIAKKNNQPGDEVFLSKFKKRAKSSPRTYESAWNAWSGVAEAGYKERFVEGAPAQGNKVAILILGGVDIVGSVVSFLYFLFVMEDPSLQVLGLSALLMAVGVAAVFIGAGMRPLNREGIEAKAKLEALRRWLKEFTKLDEAVPEDVVLWNRLLVMSVVLGVSKEVIKQLEVAAPQVLDDPLFMPCYCWCYGGYGYRGRSASEAFTSNFQSAHKVSESALASSSSSSGGGGGGGFSGGGGGGFGGGGGGGAF